MQLLLFLALAGALSGLVSGGYMGGSDGMILGGSTGLVVGVTAWILSGVIVRAIREYRLNRYFTQDSNEPK
jgi:hypothetical protein